MALAFRGGVWNIGAEGQFILGAIAAVWAGTRVGEINHNDGGRGVYFRDPDGHHLEILTRPYEN